MFTKRYPKLEGFSKRLAIIRKLKTYKIPSVTGLVTTTALNKSVKEIENKIPDTTGFITTPELNRLAKISFDARVEKATECLPSNSQVDNALDIAEKYREKIEKVGTLRMMDHKIASYFSRFKMLS